MTQSTSRSMSLNVDMQADLAQDRILLRIRYEQPVAWLLTRRLALRWVAAWIERLQAIDLPDLPPLFCGGKLALRNFTIHVPVLARHRF